MLHPVNLDLETCKTGYEPTAWRLTQNSIQEGFYLKCSDNAYRGSQSAEFGRDPSAGTGKHTGLAFQDFNAKYHRNKEFTFTVAIKRISVPAGSKVNLWCECASENSTRLEAYSATSPVARKMAGKSGKLKAMFIRQHISSGLESRFPGTHKCSSTNAASYSKATIAFKPLRLWNLTTMRWTVWQPLQKFMDGHVISNLRQNRKTSTGT
jgi:hypothetical protein